MSEREKKANTDESADAITASSTKTGITEEAVTADTAPTKQTNVKDISTKEAYFASLNEWVKHANISQNAMAMFPWYFISSYPQLFTQPASSNSMPLMGLQVPAASTQNVQPTENVNNLNAAVNDGAAGVGGFNAFGLRLLNDQAQADIINRNGGYEYIVAPFWKRFLAEVFDMIIMFVFKIVIIFVVTNIFGYNLMMDTELLNKAMDNEDFAEALLYSMDFLTFSSDLLAFEIALKLFVCLYEAILTTFFNGASLGKDIMGLRIKYVEAMVLLPNNNMPAQPAPQLQLGFQGGRQRRALLFPAETPDFKRAFVRAVAKNVILSILFPMFFFLVFFRNNRTAYDVMTKTIVVEKPTQPLVLRRQPQQHQ